MNYEIIIRSEQYRRSGKKLDVGDSKYNAKPKNTRNIKSVKYLRYMRYDISRSSLPPTYLLFFFPCILQICFTILRGPSEVCLSLEKVPVLQM